MSEASTLSKRDKLPLKLFFRFTLFGWVYAVCTLPVAALSAEVLFSVLKLFLSITLVWYISAVLFFCLCIFGAYKASVSFSTYHLRKQAYLRYKTLFEKVYRPSLLDPMYISPCERQVAMQLHDEFDTKFDYEYFMKGK
jgi:hypothetical protein